MRPDFEWMMMAKSKIINFLTIEMKKLRFLALLMTAMFGLAFTTNHTIIADIEYSDTDTVSYLIGAIYGQGLREQVQMFPGPPISIDDLIDGFVNAAKGDSIHLGMELEEAQMFINIFIQEFQSRMEESHRIEAEQFLAENKGKSGVITTESGLKYKIITEGTGPKPKQDDIVKINYEGTLIDGEIFDSSIQRGEPIELPLDNLIPGFSEGLQLMPAGSKYMLWIPIELGYYNSPGHPYNNQFLIFEVELLEIVSN